VADYLLTSQKQDGSGHEVCEGKTADEISSFLHFLPDRIKDGKDWRSIDITVNMPMISLSWNDKYLFVRFKGPNGEACDPAACAFSVPGPRAGHIDG
jgi:hypothetical protein